MLSCGMTGSTPFPPCLAALARQSIPILMMTMTRTKVKVALTLLEFLKMRVVSAGFFSFSFVALGAGRRKHLTCDRAADLVNKIADRY